MSNSNVAKHHAKKEGTSVVKKIFSVFFYVIIAIVLIFALLLTVMSLSSKDKNGMSQIFGYYIQTVESPSMSGTFEQGDIIISKEVDTEKLKVGDVISFNYIVQNKPVVVTHRIINIKTNEIGAKIFVTRGDAEELTYQEIFVGDVIAKYTGVKLSGFAKVAKFLKSQPGFFLCVLLPLFLFLFWQLYSFIKTIIEIRQVNYKDEVNNQAKVLAAEMLKQMQEQNLLANPPPAQSEDSSQHTSEIEEQSDENV